MLFKVLDYFEGKGELSNVDYVDLYMFCDLFDGLKLKSVYGGLEIEF